MSTHRRWAAVCAAALLCAAALVLRFGPVGPKDQVCMKFDRTGRCLATWTIPKGRDRNEKPGQVNWLHTAARDSKGNMYLGGIRDRRAQKFVKK